MGRTFFRSPIRVYRSAPHRRDESVDPLLSDNRSGIQDPLMRISQTALVGLLACISASAQQAGPALSIDASAPTQHAISPDIYGINFYWNLGSSGDSQQATYLTAAPGIRPTLRRWGGDLTSTYHWQFDVDSLAADWFFEVLPGSTSGSSQLPKGSTFNLFADQARTTGGTRVAVPFCRFEIKIELGNLALHLPQFIVEICQRPVYVGVICLISR